MSNEYRLESLNDLLQFDGDALLRMLPDLLVWHAAMREMISAHPEVKSRGMLWIDDGKRGQITHWELQDPATGEVTVVPA